MPFRVLGLDLIDTVVCCLLAPSSPERPFEKGAEMFRLKDPTLTIPPVGRTEHPPLREPESLGSAARYVSSTGATVMTSEELAEPRSAAVPAAPRFQRFGDRVSHMTSRYVVTGSSNAYRIWRFQSAAQPIEFPPTDEGWALAWNAFRELEAAPA